MMPHEVGLSELLATGRGCASEASRSSFPSQSGFGREDLIRQLGCCGWSSTHPRSITNNSESTAYEGGSMNALACPA